MIGFIGALVNDDDGVAGASPSAVASASEAEETPAPESAEAVASSEPPTPAPTAVPTPSPSIEPEPEFEDIELSGTGNAVPRFEIPESSAAIAEISHTGGANFVVWTVDSEGEQTDLLVNTIGNYAGTVLFDEAAGSHSVAFQVEADGTWTITIRPVDAAFTWDGAAPLTGSGDDVALLDPPSSGLKSTTITHSGDGNFIVYGYSASDADLLVNEIGAFSGEVLLADGTFLFEISANGAWTASPPQ